VDHWRAMTPRRLSTLRLDRVDVPVGIQTRTSSLGAARPLPPRADVGPGGQSVGQAAQREAKKAQLARETRIFLTASARLESGQKMRHRLLALHQMVRLRICYDHQQAELRVSASTSDEVHVPIHLLTPKRVDPRL